MNLKTLLMLGLLLPLRAHALIDGNLECRVAGLNLDGYTFTAGQRMAVPLDGTCTVKRAFPNSARLNLSITPQSGTNPAKLSVMNFYDKNYLQEIPLGSYSGACLGGPCVRRALNTQIPYTYYISGIAPDTPGRRAAFISLGVTSYGYPNYAEWFVTVWFVYNVAATGCTLSSPGAVNLSFGSISSDDLSNQTQSTSVSVNCRSAVQATVSLVPSQAVVSATTGVTRTTLEGLNMQARWTDTRNPVNFTSPRYMQMGVGNNNINLSFQPQLAPGQSPAGAFQSQYTLTIDYR
ncbi:fimbrial protein [Pseudomonas pergaminensis]